MGVRQQGDSSKGWKTCFAYKSLTFDPLIVWYPEYLRETPNTSGCDSKTNIRISTWQAEKIWISKLNSVYTKSLKIYSIKMKWEMRNSMIVLIRKFYRFHLSCSRILFSCYITCQIFLYMWLSCCF